MLFETNYRGLEEFKGRAQIVISFDDTGAASMKAFFNGRHDSTYTGMPDARLFEREIPKLTTELRTQIQALFASTVTE